MDRFRDQIDAANQAVADATASATEAAAQGAEVGVDAALTALDSGSTYDEALAIGQSVGTAAMNDIRDGTTTTTTTQAAGRVLTDDEKAALKKFRKNCPC